MTGDLIHLEASLGLQVIIWKCGNRGVKQGTRIQHRVGGGSQGLRMVHHCDYPTLSAKLSSSQKF